MCQSLTCKKNDEQLLISFHNLRTKYFKNNLESIYYEKFCHEFAHRTIIGARSYYVVVERVPFNIQNGTGMSGDPIRVKVQSTRL